MLKNALEKETKEIYIEKLGEVLALQNKWKQLSDMYKDLLESNTEKAEYFFKYGASLAKYAQSVHKIKALFLLDNIKDALNKALVLRPNYLEARWALIDFYVSIPGLVGGNLTKAEAHAKNLKSQNVLEGYLALGYVYEYKEQKEKAKENFLMALKIIDKNKEVLRNPIHYQIGKICADYSIYLERGIQHLNTYIANYSVYDGVPLKWAYYRMGQLQKQKG